ncbi:MAG: M20/M25/M40 family metallo-hydrolase [Candidatus Heimdallarchaeota archaeon]
MTSEPKDQEIFDLLHKLVALDTVNDPENDRTPNPESIEVLRALFETNGLMTETRDFGGFLSLRASLGVGRPHVLILGHLDVVPFEESRWKTNPLILTRSDENPSIAFGRGAHDDKAGVVAMLLAARDLAPQVSAGTVSFLVTMDEEIGGAYGAGAWANHLKEVEKFPDYVINTDGGVDMKMVGRRRSAYAVEIFAPREEGSVQGAEESMEFETRIMGEPTLHAAYFRPGSDRHALLAASKVIQKGDFFVKDIQGPFLKGNVIPSAVSLQIIRPTEDGSDHSVDLNLTKVVRLLGRAARLYWKEEYHSDYGISITPNVLVHTEDGTRVRFDVRTFCSQKKQVKRAFKRCFGAIEGISVAVGFGGGIFYTPKDSPLLQAASAVADQLGLGPTIIEQEGATDCRFFEGVPCVELAPKGGEIHSPNEWVDLATIVPVSQFYTNLVARLLEQQA